MSKARREQATGYSRWALINYTDVWGNAEDGWEVNNLCREYDDLWLDDTIEPQEVIEYLHETGFLTTADMSLFEIIDDGDMIEVNAAEDGQPLFRLEMMREEMR